MVIIVSGKIYVKPNKRDLFIEKSLDSIAAARKTDGCHDFAVSPDPIDMNRVNIYEEWDALEKLTAFRVLGPENDLFSLIESVEMNEYEVTENDT